MSKPARHSPEWAAYAEELGAGIARIREARGLSQERAAHKAGISKYTFGLLELGRSGRDIPLNPTLWTLLAVAQALEVDLQELLPDGAPDITDGA